MSVLDIVGKWIIGGKPEPRADLTYEEIKRLVNETGTIAQIKLANGNILTITPRETKQERRRRIHEENAW
jgi:hypothetical protein